MKNLSTLILIIGINIHFCIQNIYAQTDINAGQELLENAHNRIYFTRLHKNELPDSIIQRNIDKVREFVNKPSVNFSENQLLLVYKTRSEAYYLKAELAIRNTDFARALNDLDSAAAWIDVLKDLNGDQNFSENTFVNDAFIGMFQNTIKVQKFNVSKILIEQLFKNVKKHIKISQIQKLQSLYKLNEVKNDPEVNRIYNYLMLKYYVENRICDSAAIFYPLVKFRKTPILEYPDSIAKTPRLISYHYILVKRQIEAEEKSAPALYQMATYVSIDQIKSLLNLAGKRCPKLKIETYYPHSYTMSDMDSVAKANRPRGYIMPVLPKIPYTKCAWTNIRIDMKSFTRLEELDIFLGKALQNCGYMNLHYFGFEDGYAIMTPIEGFNKDGSPAKDADRWKVKMFSDVNTFFDYFNKLFMADVGSYRFMIFAVASKPYILDSKQVLSYESLNTLFASGANRIPEELAPKPLNNRYVLDAYIYEFEQREFANVPVLRREPIVNGKQHLDRTKLTQFLKVNE